MTLVDGWQGRFYDDFRLGDVYRSRLGRTVLQSDNTMVTLLTNNTNQIHFNAHYAASTRFGRPLVNSIVTIGVVHGLAVTDTSENGFALGWDSITLPNPVFAGDTLYAESEVMAMRPSASREGQGIVTFQTHGLNQAGVTVMVSVRSVMVWTRSAAASFSGPWQERESR